MLHAIISKAAARPVRLQTVLIALRTMEEALASF